jgi:hypothetical protein
MITAAYSCASIVAGYWSAASAHTSAQLCDNVEGRLLRRPAAEWLVPSVDTRVQACGHGTDVC